MILFTYLLLLTLASNCSASEAQAANDFTPELDDKVLMDTINSLDFRYDTMDTRADNYFDYSGFTEKDWDILANIAEEQNNPKAWENNHRQKLGNDRPRIADHHYEEHSFDSSGALTDGNIPLKARTSHPERAHLSDYFRGLLMEQGFHNPKIYWSKLSRDDIINWPEGIDIKQTDKYTKSEIKKLLLNLQNMRFSDHYLEYLCENYKNKPSKYGLKKTGRQAVSAFFRKLYNDHFGVQINRVPWHHLNRHDFVGFPEDVVFNYRKWTEKDYEEILNAIGTIKLRNSKSIE
jgi:hypothetical protein